MLVSTKNRDNNSSVSRTRASDSNSKMKEMVFITVFRVIEKVIEFSTIDTLHLYKLVNKQLFTKDSNCLVDVTTEELEVKIYQRIQHQVPYEENGL